MANPFRISLKSGERLFVNGAVLRTDRRVTLELLNDVTFLLEQHVMDEAEARTPLARLYVSIQQIIIDPLDATRLRQAALEQLAVMLASARPGTSAMAAGYQRIGEALSLGRPFEALKLIRLLLPHEACEDATAVQRRA
ncbi:MAG: flagellar biosynthesis repressor FlbT [Hyphomicrobiaceae bacterium]